MIQEKESMFYLRQVYFGGKKLNGLILKGLNALLSPAFEMPRTEKEDNGYSFTRKINTRASGLNLHLYGEF